MRTVAVMSNSLAQFRDHIREKIRIQNVKGHFIDQDQAVVGNELFVRILHPEKVIGMSIHAVEKIGNWFVQRDASEILERIELQISRTKSKKEKELIQTTKTKSRR